MTNQPVCGYCYGKRVGGGKIPNRLNNAPKQTCCLCGGVTLEGIYLTVDETQVPYPTKPAPVVAVTNADYDTR
jgi:hypothetical protein